MGNSEGVEGSNRKNHPWEGYGYFLESHITKNMPSGLNFSKLITIFQKQFEKKGFALSLILKVRGNSLLAYGLTWDSPPFKQVCSASWLGFKATN